MPFLFYLICLWSSRSVRWSFCLSVFQERKVMQCSQIWANRAHAEIAHATAVHFFASFSHNRPLFIACSNWRTCVGACLLRAFCARIAKRCSNIQSQPNLTGVEVICELSLLLPFIWKVTRTLQLNSIITKRRNVTKRTPRRISLSMITWQRAVSQMFSNVQQMEWYRYVPILIHDKLRTRQQTCMLTYSLRSYDFDTLRAAQKYVAFVLYVLIASVKT